MFQVPSHPVHDRPAVPSGGAPRTEGPDHRTPSPRRPRRPRPPSPRSPSSAAHRRSMRALLLPADEGRPVRVVELGDGALREIIGGVADDVYYDAMAGSRYCLYADAGRESKELPENPRARRLGSRLGWDESPSAGLRGDVVLVGVDVSRDTDVPQGVLAAASRCGLLGA